MIVLKAAIVESYAASCVASAALLLVRSATRLRLAASRGSLSLGRAVISFTFVFFAPRGPGGRRRGGGFVAGGARGPVALGREPRFALVEPVGHLLHLRLYRLALLR